MVPANKTGGAENRHMHLIDNSIQQPQPPAYPFKKGDSDSVFYAREYRVHSHISLLLLLLLLKLPHNIINQIRAKRRPSPINSRIPKLLGQFSRPFVMLNHHTLANPLHSSTREKQKTANPTHTHTHSSHTFG